MTESNRHRPPRVGGVRGEQVGSIPDSPPTVRVTGRKIRWSLNTTGMIRKISEKTTENGFPEEFWDEVVPTPLKIEISEKNGGNVSLELRQVMSCLKEGHFPCDCPLRSSKEENPS